MLKQIYEIDILANANSLSSNEAICKEFNLRLLEVLNDLDKKHKGFFGFCLKGPRRG